MGLLTPFFVSSDAFHLEILPDTSGAQMKGIESGHQIGRLAARTSRGCSEVQQQPRNNCEPVDKMEGCFHLSAERLGQLTIVWSGIRKVVRFAEHKVKQSTTELKNSRSTSDAGDEQPKVKTTTSSPSTAEKGYDISLKLCIEYTWKFWRVAEE